MEDICFVKDYAGIRIHFDSNSKRLRRLSENGLATVALLDSHNSSEDFSFTRYCLFIEEDNSRMTHQKIIELADDEYLRKIYARFTNLPLMIAESTSLLIRELSVCDARAMANIYASLTDNDSHYVERFFDEYSDSLDTSKEIENVIEHYIHSVYEFYDYGIWGIYLKEASSLIGIAGFTPRDTVDGLSDSEADKKLIVIKESSDENRADYPVLEISYFIAGEYQGKGYALEAVKAIIEYADNNIAYNKIIARVHLDNYKGLNFANKIKDS